MKLIIDVPEEQYNDIVKYLTDNDGNYAYSDFNLREIIRNGTPYEEPENVLMTEEEYAKFKQELINASEVKVDLISREALKAAFEKVYPLATNEMGGVVNKRIYEIINNAPTVLERPQSEWVHREELFDDEDTPRMAWGCKKCGFSLKSSHDKRGYCPNCGRQMIGFEQDKNESLQSEHEIYCIDDLIRRNELKAAIKYHCEYLHENSMDLEDILDMIDYAPTINIVIPETDMSGYIGGKNQE